jgi:hypothetical protein
MDRIQKELIDEIYKIFESDRLKISEVEMTNHPIGIRIALDKPTNSTEDIQRIFKQLAGSEYFVLIEFHWYKDAYPEFIITKIE